jgi:adenylate cyclase
MASTRRLAAILAADVAGYSRLMGADEEGTHERLRAHLAELVHPTIEVHRGRVVKNTGDGLLAEFASVVDAVHCAVDMQRGMAERASGIAAAQRIEFRVGINLGDVITEDDDIFGDGVNIAARLEALAEPGGICISRTVRDQIRDKLPYPLDDLGEQSVKNIARPVRVYALRPEAVADLPALGVAVAPPRRRPLPLGAIVGVAAAAIILAVVAWRIWPVPVLSTATTMVGSVETPISKPTVAPRLSIVVLPFANLSNDPNQQYFADGITEDLTTDLSRIADMLVISRDSAFTYKDKAVNAKQIGTQLGVRYVLEGSVQRSGNEVRVNAQLIDAETDTHLWAERFDRDISDLFAVQNEITGRIGIALGSELIDAEAARPIEHPDALDYIFQGRAALSKPPTRNNYAEAIGLFERAVALDPGSVEAQSWLAIALSRRVLDQMSASAASAAADIARAEGLVGRALAASPSSPRAHFAKGDLLCAQHQFAEAIPEYETVLASNRNSVDALAIIGRAKIFIGMIDEAIPLVERALRLSPRDPRWLGVWYLWIGQAHLLQSRTDEAILWLEKARSANPAIPYVHLSLASAYALKGESERAAAELAEAHRLVGDDRFSSIARVEAVGYWGVPKVRALYEATFFTGLRKAGMPEE